MITQRGQQSESVDVVELTDEEMAELVDREARRLLNISGEEFIQKWTAGDYANESDPHVTQVAMLLPNAW